MNELSPISEGHALLGRGKYAAAEQQFESIQAQPANEAEQRSAAHMLAITLRLERRYAEADRLFMRLLERAGDDPVLYGRVERDLGMSVLEQAVESNRTDEFSRAAMLLRSSYDSLLALGEAREAAISDGFIGRLYFELLRIDEAVEIFLRVHKQLILEDPVAALNNLIWLARSSLKYRWRYAWTARRLVSTTGHARRRNEYLVLLLGGERLYRWLSS